MRSEQISPDGTVRIEFQWHEVKMSHWIENPRVTIIESGEILLDLWTPEAWAWDAFGAGFRPDGKVALRMRVYPGDAGYWDVLIDPVARTYRFEGREPERFLEKELRRHLREAA